MAYQAQIRDWGNETARRKGLRKQASQGQKHYPKKEYLNGVPKKEVEEWVPYIEPAIDHRPKFNRPIKPAAPKLTFRNIFNFFQRRPGNAR